MKYLTSAILASTFFSLSTASQASGYHNYVEGGLGASQRVYTKDENSDLEPDTSPVANVIIGSRLNRSRTAWYELGYSFANLTQGDSTTHAHTAFTGIKLTTDPLTSTSVYLRGGIAKSWASTTTKGENGQDKDKSTGYYAGFGLNFKLDQNQSFVIDFRNLREKDADDGFLYGVFFSLNQFL